MHQELIERIKNATGASDETATQAAKAVMGFLQEKLPDSISPHVSSLMAGDSITDSVTDAIGEKLGGGLGGLFGGDK